MVLRTRVTELLGIEHPIIVGGMTGCGTPELCAACSNAGGLGTFAIHNAGSPGCIDNAMTILITSAIDNATALLADVFCRLRRGRSQVDPPHARAHLEALRCQSDHPPVHGRAATIRRIRKGHRGGRGQNRRDSRSQSVPRLCSEVAEFSVLAGRLQSEKMDPFFQAGGPTHHPQVHCHSARTLRTKIGCRHH